jgi:hypothetical protein
MNKYSAAVVAGVFLLGLLTVLSFSRAQYWKNTSNAWAEAAMDTFETAEHCLGTLNKCMDTLDTCEDLRKNKYEL